MDFRSHFPFIRAANATKLPPTPNRSLLARSGNLSITYSTTSSTDFLNGSVKEKIRFKIWVPSSRLVYPSFHASSRLPPPRSATRMSSFPKSLTTEM
ncbi:hypothetical protein TRQ7_03920 [Thermotoga sp. RQ7]|nr:hypothetical protein TRQ7_03920 [Thermotoga sp. RQ7]